MAMADLTKTRILGMLEFWFALVSFACSFVFLESEYPDYVGIQIRQIEKSGRQKASWSYR
jgi:hypothetical protein